jgi:hypothetical protein
MSVANRVVKEHAIFTVYGVSESTCACCVSLTLPFS